MTSCRLTPRGSSDLCADGAALASLLAEVKATVMQATPTTWRILIESGWAGGVRALCGGEALPPPLADALRRRSPSVWNMYGPTETTIWSSCANLGGGDAEGGGGVTLGFPIANTQLYVLDERLAPAPLGVRGELYIGGEGVARGYWRRPELTAERFVPDPFSEVPGARMYRTGDLVRRLADGRIEYLNRLDHQVKVRGYRIELGEIESALQKHPQVREAVVVVGDDRGGDARLVAYVVAREPSPPPGKTELQEHLKKTLPEYMVPPVFVALERLPLTPNGKIDRGRLPAVEAAPAPREHAPPRTATERTLVDAWRAVLHADPVGRDDDFFELGGHSLKATQLVSRVRAAFDVDLPLRVLFEAPTPALLAQEIDRRTEHRLVPLPPVTRAPSGEPPSLTYSQERIWFIHQMDPGSSAYNVTGALIVDGAVDAPCMERALREVARRHDVLLSTYAVESGRPTPKVRAASAWSLPVVDLSHHEGAEAEAKRLGMELARAPFDLARDLPYRAALYRVGPSRWVLAVSIHHIAADGWSLSIILRETFAVYGALRRGEPSPLPEPELQYRDYAHWQRKVLAPEMLAPQERFWREALAGAPDFVSFPTDKPRPPEQSTEGGFEPFELGEPLLAEVRRFARERNVTPFMVLLSAFDVLLLRHTQQADLPVGIPIANRRWLASEGFVGTLVNMLVLRADLSGDPTFDELVARVRETALSAYANQDLPFEQLVRVLQPKRSSGYTPLFQVMFDMQDLDVPALGAEGLAVQPITSHRGGCQFDLTFTNVHVAGAPIAGVEYATALYDAATIRSLIAQFLTIVREGIAAPSRRISAIPLLDAEERHTILRGWNDTAAAYDETAYAHRVFERHAAENPNAVAVRFEGQAIPYAELDRAADRLAWRLVEQGAAGGLVGVCLERTPAMLASLLATWKAGASYVPIDPAYPEARVRMILEDGRPRVLVTQRAFEAQFARAEGLSVICADDAFAPDGRVTSNGSGARRGPPPAADVTPESPAYTLFTSGSTGRPKGVQVPHRALVNFLASMRKAPGLSASDRLMAITTISFDIAGLELFLPLVVGASIDLLPHDVPTDPALLKAAFERAQPTVMQATPSMWRMLIEAGFRGSKTLKALCGGEALPPDLAQALLERTGSLWNMYGPTETTIWSTCKRMSADDPSVSIGRPIDNTQIYVLDEHREPVAVGVAGELYIGGDGVALGYLGRPDLTEERFVRDPFASRAGAKMYRTGDSARLRPDGSIEFLGRLDGQVKLRGHRIELGEIEVVLRAHPRVAEAAVAVHARSAGDQRLVGYVVTSGGAIDASELRAHLRAALPDYMVPGIYVTLEKLPLTPNGKLDRKALPALAEGSPSEAVEAPRGEAPRAGMEQALARIWEETLGVTGVTRSDDFFALGGHSMLAVQLFARIKERLGADLPMRSLYDAPTLEGLAALVERGGGAVAGPGISGSVVPIQPRGTKPPIFWIDTLGVGGGGGLLRYRLLSRLLGTEQPSYGILEPRELQPSVEQWAAKCIAWMRSVQPRGPYYLAGFCLGGNLAFEMASQLAPTNEVAMVALIESRTPYATARGTLTTGEYARNLVRSVSGFGIRTLRQSRAEQITLMAHELRRASRFAAWKAGLSAADDMDLAAFEEQVDVRHYDEKQLAIARQHFDMLMTHDWRPYAGHVHLFRSHRHGFMPRLPALGWELLAGDVTVDVVSGAHEEMLTEPHVHALAERLSARLDELHAQKPVAEEAPGGPEEEESSDASSERETVTV